jgi:hypothetical protein
VKQVHRPAESRDDLGLGFVDGNQRPGTLSDRTGRLTVIRVTVGEQHQPDGRRVDAVFFHPLVEALEA